MSARIDGGKECEVRYLAAEQAKASWSYNNRSKFYASRPKKVVRLSKSNDIIDEVQRGERRGPIRAESL